MADGISEPSERGGIIINGAYCDDELSISDGDVAQRAHVSIEAPEDTTEGGSPGKFVVKRDVTGSEQLVGFRILGLGLDDYATAGEAIVGLDYEVPSQLISPANYVTPVGAVLFEKDEGTVEIEIVPIGATNRGLLRIFDRNGDESDLVCIFGQGRVPTKTPSAKARPSPSPPASATPKLARARKTRRFLPRPNPSH